MSIFLISRLSQRSKFSQGTDCEFSTLKNCGRMVGRYAYHACRAESEKYPTQSAVSRVIKQEREAGLDRIDMYDGFAHQVRDTKRKILTFLIEAKNAGKSVVGYGAPGKGNTLLNYCGIRTDFIDYTVDRNPYKQGMYLPGREFRSLHRTRSRLPSQTM